MSRKIYLISFYFAPLGRADGINRAFLTRYLSDLGWDIEVICAKNPKGLFRNYQKDESLLNVLGPKVERHLVPYDFRGGMSEIAHLIGIWPDPFKNWVPDAIRKGNEIINESGIVYAVVPPISNANIAFELAEKHGLPLVLDFRDNVWNLPRKIVERADLILASTDWSREEMLRHYKISNTPNTTYFNGCPDEDTTYENTDGERKNMIYAGLMNWEQHPFMVAPLLAAINRNSPQSAKPFLTDFYGPRNYYTSLAFRGEISNFSQLHGYLPFSEVRGKMRLASFGLSTLAIPTKNYCIPSKVFQYLSAGLPVISISNGGALPEFINKHKIGISCSINEAKKDSQIIAQKINDVELIMELRNNVIRKSAMFSLRSQVNLVSNALSHLLG